MQVTVRAFATARERLGTGTLPLEVPNGWTLGDLVAHLASQRAGAEALKEWLDSGHLRLARNRTHAAPDEPLVDGDEVALFPPVSGG